MRKYIQEILKRKDLMLYLVTSGLKSKNRNTWLGYFWWLLDPLLNVVVYYFLVGVVLDRGEENFAVFLVIGLVVFRWLRTTVSSSAKSITGKSTIISQVYLPKAIFPIGDSITQLINFFFGLVIIALFLLFYGVRPGLEVLWLPFIILVQYLAHLAISLIMGYLCVFVRDIEHIISHIMRVMRYASPVIWETGRLPDNYQWIVEMNPLSHLLVSYRNIFMYGGKPLFTELIIMGIVSLGIIVYMLNFYNKNEHKIIKVL